MPNTDQAFAHDTPHSDPPDTTAQPISGQELIRLASAIVWPFKGLNRPLGDLLAEGAVQSSDLGWAIWKAYDPAIRWAAAVHLQARALQTVSLSPQEAAQVVWPFRGLNRPMGELLAAHAITLHDLAYAVANAYDERVRAAAAVLGAGIVRRTLPSAEPSTPSLSWEAPAIDERPAPPAAADPSAPRPQPRVVTGTPAAGPLQVVEGSTFLRDQEKRKRRQGAALTRPFLALVGLAATLMGMILSIALILGLAGRAEWWAMGGLALAACCVVGGLALLGAFGLPLLLPAVKQLQSGQRNLILGRRGEENLVAVLQKYLDERWILFRNVTLPDEQGDIDAVLVGPTGVYALEVKAHTGRSRNVRERWYRRSFGSWRPMDRNPTRQVRGNARRLNAHLKQQGIETWVEPRVVWAGPGRLELDRPAQPVWLLREPEFLLDDIEKGKALAGEMLSQIVAILGSSQSY